MSYGNYPNLDNIKRILVIKLRHLGDVLLTSPVFSVLKKRFPNAEIDVYLWKEAYPMLEGHPDIAHFFLYDRRWKKKSFFYRLSKEFSLLKEIRKKNYDLVINLTEGDRGAIAGWISKAKIRLGVDPKENGFLGKKKIYTHLVKSCPLPRHAVERNLDALRCLGIFPEMHKRELFFHIPLDAEENVRTLLKSEGISRGEFVVVHAPSRWRFKCLPPQLTAEIIDQLEENVVLTGSSSPDEMRLVEEIAKTTTSPLVKNFCGKISLKELGALLLQAKGLITVDSMALHLASALKIPVVALFGPTNELNWGPWQNPHSRVIAKHLSCRPCSMDGCGGSKMSDCLYTLSPQKVINAFRQIAYGASGEGASFCCGSAAALLELNSLAIKNTE